MLLTRSIKNLCERKLLGVLAVAGLVFSSAAHAEHYKVFLLAGQSNMDGRGLTSGLPDGTGGTVDLQSPQTDVLFYKGGLTYLQPLTSSGDQFGPEITFGRTIADALPDENFALIKVAKGGTALWSESTRSTSNWSATGDMRNTLSNNVTNARAVIEDGGTHTTEIVGMLWSQGEADAFDGRTTAEYQADLVQFISSMRTSYGADMPFFLSQLNDTKTAFAQVRAAQANVAGADANAYLIYTDDMQRAADDVHYTADGQMDLGEAFAASYLSTVPEPGSLVILGGGGLCLLSRRRTRRGVNWS